MHRTLTSSKPILLFTALAMAAGALLLVFVKGRAGTSDPASDPLTLRQTLGLAFTRNIDSPMAHLYARANPRSREALSRVLSDKTLQKYHANVWAILGSIGNEADVKRAEQMVKAELTGVLDHDEREAFTAMLYALGKMCKRGVDGACELLIQWQDPSSWKDANFQIYGHSFAGQIRFEYDMVIRVMNAYARSQPPDLPRRVKSILDPIEDETLRETMTAALDPKRLASLGKDTRSVEARTPSSDELRSLDAHFNGDLNNPGPASR